MIADDRITVRNSMLSQLHELHLLAFLDIPPGLSEAIDRYRDEYLEGFQREFEAGVLMVDGFVQVVGQKPLAAN